MSRPLTAHCHAVGESYWTHMRTAGGFGALLLGASAAAFVHALLPCFFETTASRLVGRLNERMGKRHPQVSGADRAPVHATGPDSAATGTTSG